MFLEETGFLEPARFACLRAVYSPKKYAEGLPLAGNGVILSPLKEKVKRKPVPHFMRDFLCFGGGDRAEEVPCGLLSAVSRHTPRGPTLTWSSGSKVLFEFFI